MTDSFAAKDQKGRLIGPSIGKIRELVAAQGGVNMQVLSNRDPVFYQELSEKYGNAVLPS